MTNNRKYFFYFISWTCIIVCLADFIVTYALGKQLPEYSRITDPTSKLGSSISPVALYISTWWVFIGVIYIFLGIGFRRIFADYGKSVILASWILIIYGIGEGIGSGLFPYNFVGNKITISGIFHEIFGGIAVFIILILPLVLRKIFIREKYPFLFKFFMITFIAGIMAMTLLSIARFPGHEHNFFSGYFGLWQLLFTIVIYCNLIAIGIMMMRKLRDLK